MFKIRNLILVPMLAALTACTSDYTPPYTPQPAPSIPEWTPSPSYAGPRFDARFLDFCADTDLALLGGLSTTTISAEPREPDSGPGSACLFTLADSNEQQVNLLVSASTLKDADYAERSFLSQKTREEAWSVDRAFDGPGAAAEGLVMRKDHADFTSTQYVAHAWEGDLVVSVWVQLTRADGYAETGQLADAAYAVLTDTWPRVTER